LYFYPKAMTPGCTTQAGGLRDTKAKFSRQKLVVIGFSPDPVKKLKNFQHKKKLNFDLLSDEHHVIADKYGVWGLKKFMGKKHMGINRMSFLVGIDDKIKPVIQKVNTRTHHDDVLVLVKEINK
jgi:peroxiredoxin Q/BCP